MHTMRLPAEAAGKMPQSPGVPPGVVHVSQDTGTCLSRIGLARTVTSREENRAAKREVEVFILA